MSGETRRRAASGLAVAGAALLAVLGSARAQTITQITDYKTGVSVPASLSRNGLTAAFASAGNLTGANPDHSFELFRLSVATNSLTQLTDDRVGGALFASIDDNAGLITFISQADLTGGNHDQNAEVFVTNANGTGLTQLTSSTQGSAISLAISGDGSKVVFSSTAIYACGTCGNADHSQEIFVINANGTGLRQLTSSSRNSGAPRLSDDATRVVFVSSADLTPGAPGNPDFTSEIYVIGSDGTGLRQVTSSARSSTAPFLSGNGLKIVFQSNADLTPGAPGNADLGDEVYIINYDGTGLRQLTNSKILTIDGFAGSPSIDDAGNVVVFHSAHAVLFPPQNIDGNVEIWRINATGTGLTALTSSLITDSLGSFFPTVSGDATRIAFTSIANLTGGNADGSPELFTIRADRTALTQHTATVWGFTGAPSVAADGSRLAFSSTSNLMGTDAGANAELYTIRADGTGLAKLTSAAAGDVSATSLSGDGARIAFQSSANYGSNSEGNAEIFVIQSNGTGLLQLTSTASQSSESPRISRNGTKVVFQSNGNLTGSNADLTTEVWAVNADGSGMVQLTSAAAGASVTPSVDGTGGLAVFSSTSDLMGLNPEGNSEIFLVETNGTNLRALTATAAGQSRRPDISSDGARVVFSSTADLVPGSNADGNSEIFAVLADGTGQRQITNTTSGQNWNPVLSGDGLRITFQSTAPLFGPNADGVSDLHQVGFDGTGLMRLTAVRLGSAGDLGALPFGPPSGFSSSTDGGRVGFSALGNYTGGNADLMPELWLIDLGAAWTLRVSGRAATILAWDPRAGAWTYDAIRGGLENLSQGAASVDLGSVVCLENDSPDTDTRGFEDASMPTPGRGFFYLVRSSDGASDSDYGRSSAGRVRVPSAGGCAP